MPLNNFGIVNICPTAIVSRCSQPDNHALQQLNLLEYDAIYKLNADSETPNGIDYSTFKGRVIKEPYPKIYKIPAIDTILGTTHVIRDLFVGDKKVVIHCTHGRDRTGLIVGTYRILFDGWNFDQIEAERVSYGATGIIDNIADALIMKFLKELAQSNSK